MDSGSISIRFRHPSKDLSFLSDVLGFPPVRTWTMGTPRETPKGTPVTGVYLDSLWISSLKFEPRSGFRSQLTQAIDRLWRERVTVYELARTGGSVEIYLQLVGWINNGDSIDASLLKMMAHLDVTFSVEVFPN